MHKSIIIQTGRLYLCNHEDIYFRHTYQSIIIDLNVCILEQLKKNEGVGEMAQRLGILAALPEVLNSVPSNHQLAHNNI